MKRAFIALVAAAIVAGIGATAHAQGDGPITADIPFAFTVKDKAFPAGTYVLSNADDRDPRTMELRSLDGKLHILFSVENMIPKTEPSKAELVFDKFGDHYFLRQVFSIDETEGGWLGKSREEIRLESAGAKPESHRVPLVRALKKVVKP